jgi:hypothetical protein
MVMSVWCHGDFLYLDSITFLRFGKFCVIILLNILCIPLACTSSPSSVTIICRFGLLMGPLSSYVFLLQILSLLSKDTSVVFINIYFVFKPEFLSSTWSRLLHCFLTVFCI